MIIINYGFVLGITLIVGAWDSEHRGVGSNVAHWCDCRKVLQDISL